MNQLGVREIAPGLGLPPQATVADDARSRSEIGYPVVTGRPAQAPAGAAGGREAAAGLRIGLLADCELARQGLQAMLESMTEVEIVPGADPLALRQAGGVDVLILSSSRPEGPGGGHYGGPAEVLGAKVLLLLEDASDEALEMAAASGCDGFLIRQQACARLLDDTLRRMVMGEIPMPAVLAARLLAQAGEGSRAAQRAPALPLRLTAREHQVLGHMADGLSNKQIARRLQISSHGVKRLVANVLAKLDCGNRTLAVAVALRDGLIDQAAATPPPDRLA